MKEFIRKFIGNNFGKVVFWLTLFFILDILVFRQIGADASEKDRLSLYFLSVGQGDSELVKFPGGAKILIDGGPPDSLVLENLDKILPSRDHYIDIVALSHAELDHFGGLMEVLKRYRIGAFVWNGVPKDTSAAKELIKTIKDKNIPLITLAAGDVIRYGASRMKVLWPPKNTIASGDSLNETALVLELESKNTRALFTGDMGEETENKIMADMADKVDILKVGHHGSKFSSSANFLDSIRPKVAVIEVGKNSYGHPTKEALNRLADVGAKIFRTDRDGLVKFEAADDILRFFVIK
ncbi:MAG: MBL fold metallo-hydrolase [Patescibacteria group bacterium]